MKKFLITVIILLCLPMLVLSQDTIPTPISDDLYSYSVRVNFPQEIEFEIYAKNNDSAVASLTLTITYRGVEPILISFDPEIIGMTQGGTLFRYRWDIPNDAPPPLFSRIRYTWDVRTINGLSFSITDDLDFVDQRVAWVQANDLQSQINIFHGINQLDADEVRAGIRATYDLLFANAANKPIYTLLVYPENVNIGCNLNEEEPIIRVRTLEGIEEIRCDMRLANDIYERAGYIVFNQTSVSDLQQTMINLLVKEYYDQQWNDVSVPDWFLNGLQQFYDPRTKRAALNLSQQKSRSDELLTLLELETQPDDNAMRSLWDAQSIGIILYIADTIGVDGLFEFADSIGDYETFAEAYEDHVGQSLDLLILSWRDWLFRSSSQQDFDYNPYMSITQTPTATATSTNTPTATFTPSNTPNVTSTTRPSITPIPPPPTITPLPAQSFSVQPTDVPIPTPTPVESEPLLADDGLLIRGAMGGAVILGLLMLLYFVLRRR